MAEIVVKLVNGELAGKTMQSITKEVNAAAQALKKAEIGTQAWVDANAKLEKTKQLQGDLKKQIEGTTGASNMLKAAWNKLPGAQFFNQIGDSFKMMKGGVGGLISQFGLLRTAIIATGLGALVVLLVGLISWFTKTEKGANMLSGAFKAVGAVVDVLISRLFNIGQTLKDLTSNPIKFFKDLGNDIAEAAEEGYDLVQVFDALEDQARELELADKQTEKTVSQLLLQSKNISKSYEERIAIIEKTNNIEKAQYDARMKYADDYLAAVQREVDMAEKTGTMNDELADKLKDAQVAKIQLETDLIEFQEKLENRRSVIIEKQIAERERKLKEALEREKKAHEEHQAALDNIRKLENEKRLALIDDDKTKEIEALNIATEEKIVALQGSEAQILEQIKLLREIQAAELADIDEKYRTKKAEEDAKWYDAELKKLEENAAEANRIAKEKADFQAEMDNLRLNTAQEVSGFLGDIITKDIKNEKDAKRIKKGFALVDIGINLQKELSANAITSAANPLNSVTFGAAGAAQLAGLNTASIIRSVISAARVVAFKGGGYTGDGSVDEAAGVVHRKEYVIPAHITQNPAYSGIINTLESARLRGYQAGGPVDPFQSSSPSRSVSSSSPTASNGIAEMRDLFLELIAAQDRRIDRIKVQNVVTETEDALKTINSIKAAASF
jgi:hypothetical protein